MKLAARVCLAVALLVLAGVPPSESEGDTQQQQIAINNFETVEAANRAVDRALHKHEHVHVSSLDIQLALNDAVQQANVPRVAQILSAFNDIQALAEGFRYDESWRDMETKKSPDRLTDGDVVSLKGVAMSVLQSRNEQKLAAVLTISTLFMRDEQVEWELVKTLGDLGFMRALLTADPTKDFLPEEDLPVPVAPQNGRRLACDGCSPVNAWPCSHCWARRVCKDFAWCKKAAAEAKNKKSGKDD